jgi:hypothetical protein
LSIKNAEATFFLFWLRHRMADTKKDPKKSMSDTTRNMLLLAALLGADSVVEVTKTSSDAAKRPDAEADASAKAEAKQRKRQSKQLIRSLMTSMDDADNAIALYYAIKQATQQLASGAIVYAPDSIYALMKDEHAAAMASCLRVAKALRDVDSLTALVHLRWTEGKMLDRLARNSDMLPMPGAAATGCLKVMVALFLQLPCKDIGTKAATPAPAASDAAASAKLAASDAVASAKLAAGDAAMKARFTSSKCPCDGASCTTSTLPPWPEFSPRAEPAVPADQRLGRINDEEDAVHAEQRRDGEVEDDADDLMRL